MSEGDNTRKADGGGVDRPRGPAAGRRLTWAIVAFLFLGAVGLSSWFGLNRIEKRTRENIGSSLKVVVDTIHDSLREWYRTEKEFAGRMARRSDVIRATEELLAAPRTPEALREHSAFLKLRKFFATRESSEGRIGIFLISPDKINLFSMRDSNVGVRNLIADQRPDRLQTAFEGESILVPPLESDVPLDAGGNGPVRGTPTMFLATPVKSLDGEVVAVLTVRLDPASDFTRIFRSGRLGLSGETYAFDRDGWMLTESRFVDELIEVGLMEPGEQSILEIQITDPGRRLTRESQADDSTDDRPLTLMASSAVAGKTGMNVDGYRDYRGQPVLGAWKWDRVLDVGITSEIDEAEALAIFGTTRTIVATILSMTVLLAFALAAYLVKLGRREESERRLAEEKDAVESAASAKSEFLAHMSHEIRTPLNAIIGFSQLLRRDDSLNKENRQSVRTIERSGNHLLTLINDILEMSKIEAGQLTLNVESVSLRAIAEDMREMMGLKATQKGLKFDLNWDEALPDYIDIDSGKLRQIVLNLLSNAVKFTESGGVQLIVAAVEDPEIDSNTSLRIDVIDSGPGISKEDQEKLFGAFYQSDTGRRQQGGTGLGLAISTRFAEFLGGDLSLTSEPGEGSTFTLRLPLEVSTNLGPDGAGRSEFSNRTGPEITGLDLADGEKPPRILVAEDQPANRLLMKRLLGDVGFEVHFAEDGRAAVEQVDEWDPDFVWMDLKMPEMNGDEATLLIREKHGTDLPVVALTASALTEDREGLMERGFSEFVTKPLNPTEVFDTMARFLDLNYLTKDDGVPAADDEGSSSAFGRLADLPDALKQNLRECIDLGDLARIRSCVEDIHAEDPDLADSLEEPLANFAFGSIIAAMKNSDSKK